MTEADVRITPPWLIALVKAFANKRGHIVDVCTEPDNPTDAEWFYTVHHDGLTCGWRVEPHITRWLNPPYSTGLVQRWSEAAVEAARGSLGFETLILTKDDCRPRWNRYLLDNADARCRITRGVGFRQPAGPDTSGARRYEQLSAPRWGSALWYLGRRRRRFERVFGSIGEITHLLGPQEAA